MRNLRFYFSPYYWKCCFSFKELRQSVVAFWAAIVFLSEAVAIFNPSAVIPANKKLLALICLSLTSLVWGFWVTRPKFHIKYRLNEMDTVLEIIVEDMFRLTGQYVIGSNTTFDTILEQNFISTKSLQGQFTSKYYSDIKHLDVDLENALRSETSQVDSSRTKGKNKKYPIGTVAKIVPQNQTAYFVAIADINDHGNTHSTFEKLKDALANLWNFLLNRGDMEPLVMPILGTGLSRIKEKREVIIHEIVNSFIAACSSRKFCERLTIVIHPRDLTSCDIKWSDLEEYVKHVCRYTSYRSGGVGKGTAIQEVFSPDAVKSSLTDVVHEETVNLSNEAKELLIEASKDLGGNIFKMKSLGSSVLIQTNGKNFTSNAGPKIIAMWEDALKQLSDRGLISDVGYKGEIFKVTHHGFQLAEKLRI